MTLGKFNKLLKIVNPKLSVRQRGYGDVGGIFVGVSGRTGYIARITKGELTMKGYRWQIFDWKTKQTVEGNIKKRGRKTLISILRQNRWITNHRYISMLLWGIKPKTNHSESW